MKFKRIKRLWHTIKTAFVSSRVVRRFKKCCYNCSDWQEEKIGAYSTGCGFCFSLSAFSNTYKLLVNYKVVEKRQFFTPRDFYCKNFWIKK